MSTAENTVVLSSVYDLGEVLGMINRGEVRIPNFQRPFVWRPDNMIALFESINKGFPIGNLLFWECSFKFESLDSIGPHKVPVVDRLSVNYVLDGHQRLSTIYGVLKPLTPEDNIDPDSWWNLAYDLEHQEFVHKPEKLKGKIPFIKLHTLIKTLDFLKECKRIQELFPTNSDVLIERAEKLAQNIRSFKIPITRIIGGNLNEAVEIFSRLNSSGVRMTPDQMLSALTYREGATRFSLAERIDETQEKLAAYGFENIDRIFIFRAFVASQNRDIYRIKYEDLAQSDSSILKKFEVAEEAMLQAAAFLNTHIGIPGDKLLPYNLQFVCLSEFFRNCSNPSSDQALILKNWFWQTSYTAWFAGLSSSKVSLTLDDMRILANIPADNLASMDSRDSVQQMPERLDLRYARVKCFVLFLKSLEPRDIDTGFPLNPDQLLREHGSKALVSIFPKDNSPYNKLLIGPQSSSVLQKLMDTDINADVHVLKSLGIDSSFADLLRNPDRSFITRRAEYLSSLEFEFMKANGVNPSAMTFQIEVPYIFDSYES